MKQHLYTAEVRWRFEGENFAKGKYSRGHTWHFDGGVEVPASASPLIVPRPHAVAEAVDPEEALVAAVSSCHMMTFLDLARRAGLVMDAYEDRAEAVLEEIAPGRMGITRVTLRPQITFRADVEPDSARLTELHEQAHDICFIANSVKCEITVAPEPARLVAP